MSFFPRTIEKVAIIGGGPCGAGAAKALLGEETFKQIKIYEKRPVAGGLWNYYEEPPKVEYPSLDPFAIVKPQKLDDPEKIYGKEVVSSGRAGTDYFWPTAVYELLDTNVCSSIMEYANFPWEKGIPLFPKRADVLNYIRNYTKEVEHLITFGVNVFQVTQLPNQSWEIKSRQINEATNGGLLSDPRYETTEIFDAVILAVGSYDMPHVPEKKGLAQWLEKYPDSISHSKSYRHPRQFENLHGQIIVVGNSASASDIAFQLVTVLDRSVYKSCRSENLLPAGSDERIKEIKDIDFFDAENKTVHLIDGTSVDNVDHVIFATGFLRSFPFLNGLNAHSKTPLITDGARVHGMYHHCLSRNFPGLGIIGLPRFVLPTRLSETQGVWLSRVFSGRLQVPSVEVMKKEEEDIVTRKGDGRNFHDMNFPEDVLHYRMLNREIYSAGLDHGFMPVPWNEEQTRLRGSIKQLKEAYIAYRRRTGKLASTIEELEREEGFVMPEVDKALFGFE
ncbi:unnamed protein product [Kuraishia capsulata CBS 1993]|uniref:FAD/NAD(P)-binding domain-containing protein n=1 Tax=Kuraishia capsulata CBS 1993 TaxID=1382522 RepID=W6MWA5_9ASCO|nr:uncharacterized protein KUCA_T00003082001 [Kuraishia capsulata CBS 1993]CDK27105.1 unnamed protein product [Kuraishia capsulata CBS 1993]